MPMHDWQTVEAGVYHAFHLWWIAELSRELNCTLLPKSIYALLQPVDVGLDSVAEPGLIGGAGPRRVSRIEIRLAADDSLVAMIEIVSPGNKNSAHAFRSFVQKASEVLGRQVHLLILDPFPPGPHDPNGVHAAIWDDIAGEAFTLPSDKPLTLVAYEVEYDINAYAETIAVGDPLPDMPLFLSPERHVLVPLEKTYMAAWAKIPERWQRVIAPDHVHLA
ncbi:MAG: DUF4058 family protein [Fimbriiglobus sp.]